MELYQIRYFLAVSDTLNFTRAAEQCHVSQPSLTRAVKKLEGELGEVPLVGLFGNGAISHNRVYGYTGVLSLFL